MTTMAWDENYDVPSVGIYDKNGRIFIDRTAAKALTLDEKWKVYNHEVAEYHLRRGKFLTYQEAHEKALKAVQWSPELQEKLHGIARIVEQNRPKTPPNMMYSGALNVVGTSAATRTVALEYGMRCSKGHLWGFGEKVFKIGQDYFCPIDGGRLH